MAPSHSSPRRALRWRRLRRGESGVDTLRRFADAPLPNGVRARSAQYEDIAVVTQWDLWHGDRHWLRARSPLDPGGSPRDSLRRQVVNRIGVALLHAIAANTGGSRNMASVDSLEGCSR